MSAARASRFGTFLLAGATAALFVPAVPGAASAVPPPLGSACTIEGTPGPDILDGTTGDDVICGYAGDDTIDGLGGDDLIIGGAGADTIEGGDGADDVRGGTGTDTITGGAGTDALYGDGDADSVSGGDDADIVTGGNGDDTLNGGLGDDTLWGQAGADTANGDDGADKIDGGADADVLHGNLGEDKVNGSTGDDDLYGDEANDVLRGGAGNDEHFGGTGDDIVHDQDGAGFVDTVTCGDGAGDVAFVDYFDSVNVDCESSKAIDRDDPVAVDDDKTVIEDSVHRKVDVLANDTDADGGPINVTGITQPAHGAVTVAPSKQHVYYTPNADYCNTPPGTAKDTFTYTLSPGGSTATVSVKVACRPDAPVATDDAQTVLEDAAATTIDVLNNDSDPDSVGLGVLSTTDPAHGTVAITNGGADLTYTPDANYCNDGLTTDDFDYTLTNGGDTGTVKMTVTCVQDDPIATNDSTTILEDAAATTINVLANDSDADGDAFTIQSATDPANGTVAITNGGADLTYTPDPNYCNDPPGNTPDTFDYALTPGGASATVEVTVTCVNDNPVADDESFATAIGNTDFVVDDPTDAAPSVTTPHKTITGDILDGDTDIDSAGPLTVTAETKASAAGGSVTIEADGDFVFTPKAGQSCTDHSDSFNYTLNDGDGGTDTGTVSITIANCVWYVKNDSAAGGTGVSNAPFDTITEAETASLAGETIFVYDGDGTSTGLGGDGLVLKANQQLIGEYVGLTIGLDALVPASPAFPPVLTATNADVVTLASGNTVSGIVLDPNGSGGGFAGGVGDNGGTLTKVLVSDQGTAGTQPMVELDGVSGAWTLSGVSANNTNATGQSASSSGIRINNTTGSITFVDPDATPDPFENNSFQALGARAIDASNAAAVSGKVFARSQTSTNGGVVLSTVTANAGTGLTFSGVQVTTAGGSGFSATSSGPITITNGGGNNSIVNTNGRGLVVQNTTITSGNVTFSKVSSTGGDVGILLDNTGNQGRLVVSASGAGTCTNADTSGCLSGVITGQTGADSASTTPGGTGIVLNNTLNPSFSRMWIHDVSNYGIRGNGVAGFALSSSVINGANGTNDDGLYKDSSVRFTNLSGAGSFTNSFFSGGCADNLWVENTSGDLAVDLTSSTFGTSAGVCGLNSVQRPTNDALTLEAAPGAGKLDVSITNSTFSSAAGDLFQYTGQGGTAGTVNMTGNTFTNGNSSIATGGGGVSISTGVNTAFTIQGNTFRDAVGAGLLMVKLGGNSSQTGTFTGNTIGASGVANSGSKEGSDLLFQNVSGGTQTWSITNNQMYQFNNYGIQFKVNGGGSATTGAINATITGNTIAQPGSTAGTIGFPKLGIHVNTGTFSGDNFATCMDIGGAGGLSNTLNLSGDVDGDPSTPDANDPDIRLVQRFGSTLHLPGYIGASNSSSDVQTYLNGRNSAGTTSSASYQGPGTFVGGSACAQP